MTFDKKDLKNINFTHITQFSQTIPTPQEQALQKKIKENEAYIEHIKVHDKKAYEKYLSYSSYLRH